MVPHTRYDIITPLVGVIEVLLRCVDCAAGERYLHRVHSVLIVGPVRVTLCQMKRGGGKSEKGSTVKGTLKCIT